MTLDFRRYASQLQPVQKMTFSVPFRCHHFQPVGYLGGVAFILTGMRHMCHQRLAWKRNEDSVLWGNWAFCKNKRPMFDHGVFVRQIGQIGKMVFYEL